MEGASYRRIILISLIANLIFGFASAQVIQLNTKNNSVDYQRLARIDTVVNEYVNKKWLAGAVSIIIKDNQVVQYKGYGYADVDTKSRCPVMTRSSGSCRKQKPLPVSAFMILYEEGKLLLDEPI